MTASIAIVDAGVGNLRSVEKALEHVGAKVVVTADPDVVRRADKVVVPGQGGFKDCMAGLTTRGLDVALREVIARGVPYFGMCLGLQILFEESDEHGPVAGLGLLRGRVVRFPQGAREADGARVKVPHMGWNVTRRPGPPAPILVGVVPDGAYFYFVHSYYAAPADPYVVALTTRYAGLEVCAAVKWQNLFATQFHPEKSQAVGLALLRAFVAA